MRLQTRFWTRLLKKLALSAAVLVAGVWLGEVGMRTWLRLSGTPYDAARTEKRLRDATDPIAAAVPHLGRQQLQDKDGKPIAILHPFAGAESEHDAGGFLTHFRTHLAPNEYSVVVVGGSVAAFFASSAATELEQILSRDPRLAGRTVRVLNYAHATYKEPQQLTRLAYLLSFGYRPDAVINLDGFNEVALAYENATLGTNPVYPSFPVWGRLVQDFGAMTPAQLDLMLKLWQLSNRARDLVDRSSRWKLCESCLAGRIVDWRLTALLSERSEVQSKLARCGANASKPELMARQLNGPEFDAAPDKVYEMCVRNWFESSLSIQALCRARGIAYLHVLQPTLDDPGSKRLSPEERDLAPGPPTWKPAVLTGYPMLRARSKYLERAGVHFLDASRTFADVTETLYDDACHFHREGSSLLARQIGPYFLEHVLDRNPTAAARGVKAEATGAPR